MWVINNLKFQLQQLPHLKTTLPKTWINIRQELERLFEEEGKDYISLNEYYKICADMKVTDRTFQLKISQIWNPFKPSNNNNNQNNHTQPSPSPSQPSPSPTPNQP